MCLIAFAWKFRPDFPLVVAANRDEFYDRPAAPAGFWGGSPNVLAGRDLVGGGTWLGITRGGRFAAVTNYRDPSERLPGPPSRGALVRDYLLGEAPPQEYLTEVARRGAEYQGFNLLAADRDSLFYFGNRDGAVRLLPPGVYALSNGLLGTLWPKAIRARKALESLMERAASPDPELLFSLLADTTRPPDGELPDTGIGLEWERLLSSAFIASPGYGTRASTALVVDAAGTADFRERTFNDGKGEEPDRRFVFSTLG